MVLKIEQQKTIFMYSTCFHCMQALHCAVMYFLLARMTEQRTNEFQKTLQLLYIIHPIIIQSWAREIIGPSILQLQGYKTKKFCLYWSQLAHPTRVHPDFYSIQWPGVSLFPPSPHDGILVDYQLCNSILSDSPHSSTVHFYISGWREAPFKTRSLLPRVQCPSFRAIVVLILQ